MLSLDEIEPQVKLAVPSTAPTPAPASTTLQLYARARDAMLSNDRAKAIRLLETGLEKDPYSAQMLLDLTYCLLGDDNEKAAVMLQRALAIDPQNTQSRIALARLRLVAGDYDRAVTQLRYARLTEDYQASDATRALVDLMLARSLERAGYIRAAADTYEALLPQVLSPSLSMRSSPELAELIRQPDGVRIVLSQLCRQIGRHGRAIELLESVQKSQPALRDALELQIVRAHAAAGEIEKATDRLFELARRAGPVRQVIETYNEIYANHGGAAAALDRIDESLKTRPLDGALRVIGANLSRSIKAPERGLRLLEPVIPDVLAVRETARCYLQSKDLAGAARRLSRMMSSAPGRFAAIRVGWLMLADDSLAQPMTIDDLAKIDIPSQDEAARQYAIFTLTSARARPIVAARARTQATQLSPANVRVWDNVAPLPPAVDVDANDPQDVISALRDVHDDPTYLLITTGQFLQNKQQPQLISGMMNIVQSDPSQLLILSHLAELLKDDNRTPEAIQLIDKSVNASLSANQLYLLGSMYMRIGEDKSNERLLRLALQRDPNYAAVCNDLGYQLADAGRETEYAQTLIRRAVDAEPENVMYLDSLGWVYYKHSQFEDAAKWLEAALDKSLMPDPVILDHAGDAYYRLSQFDKARERWEASIEQIRNGAEVEPQLRLRIELKLKTMASKKPVEVAPTLSAAPDTKQPTTQQETNNGRP